MPWVNGHYVAEVAGEVEAAQPAGQLLQDFNVEQQAAEMPDVNIAPPQAGIYGGGIAQYGAMDAAQEAPRAGRLRYMVADYAGKTTPGPVSKEYNSMSRSNFSYINQMEWRMWAFEQARRAAASGQLGKHDLTDVITQARLIESYLYSDPRAK